MTFHRYHKLSTVVLCATMSTIGLTACTTPEQQSTQDAGSAELNSLTFVNPIPAEPVWRQIGDCMKEQAEANGLEFTESGPSAAAPSDPTVMIQQIQDAAAAGTDAIVTFPSSAAFGPVLQQAQQAGVVTATLYGDGSPESGATVNAGVDWGVIGSQYVEAISAIPGEHVVGLVAEAPTGVGQLWIDGVTAAADKTDNVAVSDSVYIGADASQALPQVTALLSANPDIDIVASNTGMMTQGGVAAVKSLGLEGQVHLLAINNANGGPEAVRDGIALGVFLQDLCGLAKDTVDGLIAVSEGEDVSLIEVNSIIATLDDMDDYLDEGWN